MVGSRVLWLDLCPSCCVFWVWQTIGCEPVVCTWVCMRMWWRGGVPRPPTQFSSTCNPTPRGDCSMLDGQTDEFRVLAVRRNNSGPGFGGSSGGIGVAEVAGDVSFNPSSLYHDVQWRPLVSVLVCVCACARERQLCVLPLCSVLFVMETMSRLECSLLPSPPPSPADLGCVRRVRGPVDGLACVHTNLRQSLPVLRRQRCHECCRVGRCWRRNHRWCCGHRVLVCHHRS